MAAFGTTRCCCQRRPAARCAAQPALLAGGATRHRAVHRRPGRWADRGDTAPPRLPAIRGRRATDRRWPPGDPPAPAPRKAGCCAGITCPISRMPRSATARCGPVPTTSHAVYPADALAAARWRRATDRPAVFSYMGIPDRPGVREFRRGREVMLSALRGCDVTAALAATRRRRSPTGRVPGPGVPPGVDLEGFRPGAARAPGPTIICSAAADQPRKKSAGSSRLRLVRRSGPCAVGAVATAEPRGRARGRRRDRGRRRRMGRPRPPRCARAGLCPGLGGRTPVALGSLGLALVEARPAQRLSSDMPAAAERIIDLPRGPVADEPEPVDLAGALLEAMDERQPEQADARRAGTGLLARPLRRELPGALPRARGWALIRPPASRREPAAWPSPSPSASPSG